MYRMLIVEDEEIEREGLRDLFDWNGMGIEVVGAVESGEDANDFTSEHEIDILFTDIKLTGMTGLELAKSLLIKKPDLKIIISSGFRDFEFAKSAVDLDAYGFLSKPIEVEELVEVVTKVLNTCKKENSEREEKERLKRLVSQSMPFLKSNYFNYLLHNSIDENTLMEKMDYFGIKFIPGQYTALVIEIDDFDNLKYNESLDEMYIMNFEVLECINSFKSENIAVSFQVSGSKFCTIINTCMENIKELHEKVMNYATGLQKIINGTVKLNITIGIGKATKKLSDIKSSYKEASKAVEFKFYMGSNQIINYVDITGNLKEDGIIEVEDIEIRILSSMELCDRETLNHSIDLLFEVFKSKKLYSNIYVRSMCINLLARASLILIERQESYEKIFGKENLIWEKIMRFDNLFDIRQWFINIFNSIIEYLSDRKEGNNKKIIKDVLKTIEENYSKNLTISDIANEIYLSANYVGIIFKKEMGESFTDYLVRFRLEKAKKMLKETPLKVYQIGSMVGYSNISYFCSIFKNSFGVSPSEYREKI